jgi:SAM-dependent methyltransferase
MHSHFEDVLAPLQGRQARLIELGCAQSKWLPYFARHWRFHVAGLDTSELGCQRAREMLAAAGVSGAIQRGDMFHPPPQMRDCFDVVLSIGLVEHFTETTSAVAACAAFAKPGGIVLTIIPNMNGIVGLLQRTLDRSVYDLHVPLDVDLLAAAHVNAGLSVSRCEYLLSANFAVVNHPGLRPRVVNTLVRSALIGGTGVVWTAERFGFEVPPSRRMSPYVSCVALKSSQ